MRLSTKQGIYLTMAAHFSRIYHPGDVDLLKTEEADRKAWHAAMDEPNPWDWQKSIDPYKMLAATDERAALLKEFTRKLLTHVNPYSKVAYAKDGQVLTFEVVNESYAEYAIICGNRFPKYWQDRLEVRWKEFAEKEGVNPGNLYEPANDKIRTVRAHFLRKLDEDYLKRIKAVVRSTGRLA